MRSNENLPPKVQNYHEDYWEDKFSFVIISGYSHLNIKCVEIFTNECSIYM